MQRVFENNVFQVNRTIATKKDLININKKKDVKRIIEAFILVENVN